MDDGTIYVITINTYRLTKLRMIIHISTLQNYRKYMN